MIIEVFVGNILDLTQTVKSNPQAIEVESVLNLTHSVRKNIRTRKIQQLFTLSDRVSYTLTKNVTIAHTLPLQQSPKKAPIEVSAYNGFIFWHSVAVARGGDATNRLLLKQTVNVYKPNNTSNNFTLQQTVGLQVIRNRIVTQTLSLISKTTSLIYDIDFVAITLPPTNPTTLPKTINFPSIPTTTIREPTIVEWDYNNYKIALFSPEFGNSLKLEFSRLAQKTRGNDSIIKRDPMWPKSKILKLSWDYLTSKQADKLKYFLRISLGKKVKYKDHFGRLWEGIILNPQAPVSQTGRCTFSIEVEYQAERI